MKRGIALVLLALAAAGGCGESAPPGEDVPPVPAGAASTPQDGRGEQARRTRGRERARTGRGCDALGINQEELREGVCVERGVRYVVANGRSLMRLRTLHAAIRGLSTAPLIPTGRGQATRPQNSFLVVRLSVQNRDGVPRRFEGRVVLAVNDQFYPESVQLERRFDQALAFRGRRPLAPGATTEGHVVFDIPTADLGRVETEGRLFIVNYGEPSVIDGGRPREVGQFRLFT